MENGKCVLCDNPVGKNNEGLCDECFECLEPTYSFPESGVTCEKREGID